MKKKNIHYAWSILLGVILIRGSVGGGLNTTSGLFLSPISQGLDAGIGILSTYFSITSIVMAFWLPFAGTLINWCDIRVMVAAGAALQTLSLMAFGLLNQVYGWYILSIPYAIGATISVSLLDPILINQRFTKNAGLMVGTQMAFAGLFGVVLQSAASNIIFHQGWRTVYFLMDGAAFLVVILTLLAPLRNKLEDKHLPPLGADIRPSKQGKAGSREATETAETVEIPEKTAIYSISPALLLLSMTFITGIGAFSQHIPNYGSLPSYTPSQTEKAPALASVGSATGSIVISIINDRVGSLKTRYGMIGIGFLSILGFLFSGNEFGVFSLSTSLHRLVSSSIMVLAPILTLKFYGRTDYEKIFAKLSMRAPIPSIVLIPAYGFIFDLTESHQTVLVIILCLSVIVLLSTTLGWKNRCTQAGCVLWKK